MIKYLLHTVVDVYKDEGLRGVIRETLKYLSLYSTPDKLLKCKARQLTNPIVTKEIQGSKMILNLKRGGIHTDLFMHGYREPEATRVMHGILTKDMTVLDIGANIGYYALMESKVCKRVIALEPDIDNYTNLKKNIAVNKYTNIQPYLMAAGDKDGTLEFALSKVPNWHRVAVGGEKDVVIVPVSKVDTFLDKIGNPKIDLLRMDVEGYEYNILEGAKETIKRDKPDMFIEIHRDLLKNFGNSALKLFKLLAEYDYSVYKSFVLAKPSYTGKIHRLLEDKYAIKELMEKGMATHIFFRYQNAR
jgi:FkbM family methyltransferase